MRWDGFIDTCCLAAGYSVEVGCVRTCWIKLGFSFRLGGVGREGRGRSRAMYSKSLYPKNPTQNIYDDSKSNNTATLSSPLCKTKHPP